MFLLFYLGKFVCVAWLVPLSWQIDAHIGAVNDLAFAHPNKQLCLVSCGDDKQIRVRTIYYHMLQLTKNTPHYLNGRVETGVGFSRAKTIQLWRSRGASIFHLSSSQGEYSGITKGESFMGCQNILLERSSIFESYKKALKLIWSKILVHYITYVYYSYSWA